MRINRFGFLLVLSLLIAAVYNGNAQSSRTNVTAVQEPVPVIRSISGRVVLKGNPLPERVLPLDAQSAAVHGKPVFSRHYVVDASGGLANVVVYLKDATELPGQFQAPDPVRMTIRGSIYEQYVVAMRTGQILEIEGKDSHGHNVHSTSRLNREVNKAQMSGHNPVTFTFQNPEEFIRLKCDVHPWEFGYVSVFNHPFFAVTDANGNFQIRGALKPGRYEVVAHHLKAGKKSAQIEITDQPQAKIDFIFDVPQAPRNPKK